MITKISKRLLISLSFIICHLSFSVAQTYTLEQLKQLAVDNNYSLRSARNSIQQSQEQKKSAFTNYFPRLSALGLGFTSNKYLIDVDIELPDVLAAMIPQGLIPSNISMIKSGIYGSITALQPVFMGGQIINGNKLAKVGVQASEIQLEASEDQVELTTEQYYWQIVSLKEKLLTLGTVHEMLVELEKDVNNMVRVGAVNRNDLLQVQLTRRARHQRQIGLRFPAAKRQSRDERLADAVPFPEAVFARHAHFRAKCMRVDVRIRQ